MPNPPKLDPVRGLRGRGQTRLPADGRKGSPPRWPLSAAMTTAERAVWRQLWTTPQSVAWERLGVGCVRVVARYTRLLVRVEEAGAGATLLLAVNAMEDRLGLTPKAMRLLLWEVSVDEVAERREQGRGARDRIRAVAGPPEAGA